MLFILFFLLKEGLPLLREASLLEVLLGNYWYPTADPPDFGMFPLVVGSLSVTLVASLIALPISIGAAVFLSEICPPSLREWLKPVLEVLGFFPLGGARVYRHGDSCPLAAAVSWASLGAESAQCVGSHGGYGHSRGGLPGGG